jgi:hypothetical protein
MALIEVRLVGHSRLDLLTLSFSHFDPQGIFGRHLLSAGKISWNCQNYSHPRLRASVSPFVLIYLRGEGRHGTSRCFERVPRLLEHPAMLTASQCQKLASEYKSLAQQPDVSKERVAMLINIARSLAGLATQLDKLAAHIRDKGK